MGQRMAPVVAIASPERDSARHPKRARCKTHRSRLDRFVTKLSIAVTEHFTVDPPDITRGLRSSGWDCTETVASWTDHSAVSAGGRRRSLVGRRSDRVTELRLSVLSGAVRDALLFGRRRCSTWPAGHFGNHRCSAVCRTAGRFWGGRRPRPQVVGLRGRAARQAGRRLAIGR